MASLNDRYDEHESALSNERQVYEATFEHREAAGALWMYHASLMSTESGSLDESRPPGCPPRGLQPPRQNARVGRTNPKVHADTATHLPSHDSLGTNRINRLRLTRAAGGRRPREQQQG
jgi:hypothetical protein